MYVVTKTYGANQGLSCVFRQWRATSHCRFLHGYALSIKLVWECEGEDLDDNGWVIDFGGLKNIKEFLCHMFDHTFVVAEDDPQLNLFKQMSEPWNHRALYAGDTTNIPQLVQLRVIPRVGCEGFARFIFDHISRGNVPSHERMNPKAQLVSVEVREHEGNSAIYKDPSAFTISPKIVGRLRRLIDDQIQQRERSRARTGI